MAENILNRCPLFWGIEQGDIREVLGCLSAFYREYPKDAYIIREGEPVGDIGILMSGTARSVKTDVTGKQVIVTLIEPGNYIGVLLAASHARKSPVSVQAGEDVTALFIPMRRILSRGDCPHHAKLLGNLFDGIAEKALVLHDRNDCLIRPTVRDKVLTFLTEYSHKTGSASFSISMNREAMAEYLNVDRSALSRELSRMKRDGLIDYEKSRFTLHL